MATPTPLLRRDGGNATLVIDVGRREPAILYFGLRLPDNIDLASLALAARRDVPPSSLAVEPPISLTPTAASGWAGPPGLAGHDDRLEHWAPHFHLTTVTPTAGGIELVSLDAAAGLELTHHLALADTGVLTAASRLRCIGERGYILHGLTAPVLPLPGHFTRLLGVGGRWAGEFQLTEQPLAIGALARENRRGRTSHDAFPGLVLLADGAGEQQGLALGLHFATSGNHFSHIERFSDGRGVIMLGDLLMPGDVRLEPGGEAFIGHALHACVSDSGLTGIASAFQSHVRRHILPPSVAARPRPVHYNSWEAVYFDHDEAALRDLIARAAALGVERFVLDDGWFGGRRHDRAGLGDWWVSPDVYPQGLGPLIAEVQRQGMEFGLWVEPEMVNPDSDLYWAHPDWVLALPGVPQVAMRHQLVLDLGNPAVTDHLFERLDTLLRDHPIAYLKWDMNRDISHPGPGGGNGAIHARNQRLNGLIDRLRAAHPQVEIESCASGGGRANWDVLARAERLWPSDSNDALDRLAIQRGAGLFFPPEVLGSHVGPRDCHTTGRRIGMATRAGVALFGHMGLEMDLRELTPEEAATLAAAIALHKRLRPLLHRGRALRLDRRPHDERWGVIAGDDAQAVFGYALTASLPTTLPGRFWCTGLDPAAAYRLDWIWPPRRQGGSGLAALDGTMVSGALLMHAGVELPMLRPQDLLLFELTRISGSPATSTR